MREISPSVKGLVTGIAMIVASLAIYYNSKTVNSSLQYTVYALYIAGILWTLFSYKKISPEAGFKSFFSQGFKCFIVVTLLMVGFTYFFLKLNPELGEQMGQEYRKDLVAKGNKTEAEINTMVNDAKKYYVTMLISAAIFSYLVIGALVTLIASGYLSMKKRNSWTNPDQIN